MSNDGKSNQKAKMVTVEETKPKIAEVLERHRGERHVIVLHDFPDPDAISSAFAHQLLSQEFGIETDIIYNGRISHQQNIAMVRLLGVELKRFTETTDLQQYKGAIFIDGQGTSAEQVAQALEAAGVPVLIVVDHHEFQERLQPEFSDIRPFAGATATIYTEYLQQLLTLDKSQREHARVATALMHGIMTDTNNYTLANPEDFYAVAFLSQYRDGDLLGQILSQARSRQVMEIIRRALGDRITAENYSIASIGYVRVEDRDAIPQAADFLLTEENVHTAIVYGIVIDKDGKESLVGSMRTAKITLDPDTFIKETFGQDTAGHYFGGGKTSAGAFEIPIGFLSGNGSDEYRELKWQVYDQQMKQKIFARAGIEIKAKAES
jgi:nanoRNase/pAp phosphatase (c-di-AMP/oligoRNAs hydrolase)